MGLEVSGGVTATAGLTIGIREAGVGLAGPVGDGGRDFRVVLIREGLAKSGRFFTRRAVEDVARLAEGSRAFADHPTASEDRERPVRSIRDVVGWYSGVAVEEDDRRGTTGEGAGAQAVGTLHVAEAHAWLASMAREALAAGQPGVIGLSIESLAVVRAGEPPCVGRRVPVVESVEALKSVDVVTRPSAGGGFLSVQEAAMVAAADTVKEKDGRDGEDRRDERAAAVRGADGAGGGAAAREAESPTAGSGEREEAAGMSDGKSGLGIPRANPNPGRAAVAGWSGTAGVQAVHEAAAALAAAERVLAQVRETELRLGCRETLEERLAAAETLPAPVREKVRKLWAPNPAVWATREAYAAALDGALAAEVEALAALRELIGAGAGSGAGRWGGAGSTGGAGDVGSTGGAGTAAAGAAAGASPVTGHGAARVTVAETDRQQAVVQVALDRLFGLPERDDDPDVAAARRMGVLPGVPRWAGLLEAYAQITGDPLVTGAVNPGASIVREANEVTTSVLNNALLNSMTKRLVRDYAGQPQEWRKCVTIRALKDFKAQDRVRLNDFATLSTVAEGGAYTNLAWDDAKEAYAPTKRGNLVVVTREAILNDDLDAVRKIPTKLAVAAGITINEFVYGQFTGNPGMADGSTVFDDGVQTTHANHSTAALSAAALEAAITAMLKQTNSAGKRLNVRPRYLLVPPDLLFAALTIVNSTLIPGSANNDVNVLRGVVEPISVAQFTDPTDWYLVADPAVVEGLEIGFVGGREAPELLLQDHPTQGAVFTNDALTYKIRWEFGGGWVDYRGAHWAEVTG
jgi:hypothetical protein